MRQNVSQIAFIAGTISYSFTFIQDQSIQLKIRSEKLNYETSIDNSSLHLHQLSCKKLYEHIYYQYVYEDYAPQQLCSIDQLYLYLTFSFPKRSINQWACPLISKPEENVHKNQVTAQFTSQSYNRCIEASLKIGLASIQQKLSQATLILQQKIQDGIHQIEALVSHERNHNQIDPNIVNQYSRILDQKINVSTQALTYKNMKLTEEIMLMLSKYEKQIMTIDQNSCELNSRINDLSMEHSQNIDDLQDKIQKLMNKNNEQIIELKNKLKQITKLLNNNKTQQKNINNKLLAEYNLTKDTIQVKQSDLLSLQQQMQIQIHSPSNIQSEEQQYQLAQESQPQAQQVQLQSSDQSSLSEEAQINQQRNQKIDPFSIFHKQETEKYQIRGDNQHKEKGNKTIQKFEQKNREAPKHKRRKVSFTQQHLNMNNTAILQIFIIINTLLYQPTQDNLCYLLDQKFLKINLTNIRIYIRLKVTSITSFIQSFKIP